MTRLILSIALCLIPAAAWAAQVEMPVRASVIQCGTMDQMAEACQREPVCCRFIEPAAGPETDTPTETKECEVMVMPDGQAYPGCVINKE